MRLLGQFQARLFLFLRKDYEGTKTQIKPKPTNKTKASKQKTTKATIFRVQKLLSGGKWFVLMLFVRSRSFYKKKNWLEIVFIALFTILL